MSLPHKKDNDIRKEERQPALGLAAGPFPTEPLSVPKAWKCPGCGTENSGKFCSECGLPHEQRKEVISFDGTPRI